MPAQRRRAVLRRAAEEIRFRLQSCRFRSVRGVRVRDTVLEATPLPW